MRVDPQRYGESILLAVSGGVDSMVMATLFVQSGLYRRIAIAHCNFHLRGEESDGDTELVRKWASEHSVECFVKDFDTSSFASEKGVSIEMAARELRYRWFDELCAAEGFTGVCVAHNADDNAETLFLNLLRGTGLRGICAMKDVSCNPFGASKVFRPILSFSRAEIMDYSRECSVPYRTDSTNLECDCKRNILRNKVFPLLKEINPSLVSTLGRNISHFNEAADIVDGFVAGSGFAGRSEVQISQLKAGAHWKYMLYSWLNGLGFNQTVIGEVTNLLESDRIISGKIFESEDYTLVATTSSLLVRPRSADGKLRYKVECLPWQDGMSPRSRRGEILMDADALGGEPVIRPWKEGDWLQPIGLQGRKKVSDMLTDLKYDVLAKRSALVVENAHSQDGGSHVMALVGERIDRAVRITSSTTRVYRISIL